MQCWGVRNDLHQRYEPPLHTIHFPGYGLIKHHQNPLHRQGRWLRLVIRGNLFFWQFQPNQLFLANGLLLPALHPEMIMGNHPGLAVPSWPHHSGLRVEECLPPFPRASYHPCPILPVEQLLFLYALHPLYR